MAEGQRYNRTRLNVVLRRFAFDEAKYVINTWHYSAQLSNGTEFFGATENGKPIATAVFFKTAHGDEVIELLATAKDPEKKFYMSQLLKYCRNQLKDKYNIIVTYYETTRSKGIQAQGDHWNYGGTVTAKQLIQQANGNQYLYWIPLNKAGESLAKTLGLEAKPYPK